MIDINDNIPRISERGIAFLVSRAAVFKILLQRVSLSMAIIAI